MSEDYIITLVSRQTVEGETSRVEMTALADFQGSEDDYRIRYTDEDGDLKGCVTTLHVENGRCITMSRDGDYGSHMMIEKGVRHVSQNGTPYGTFSLGVHATEMVSAVKDGSGTLHFRYLTDLDLCPLGDVEFDITICPRKK